MKKLLFLICAMALAFPAGAVLNEPNLKQQLSVLRLELEQALKQQKQTLQILEQSSQSQRERMREYMEESNKVSLMLYSQRQDFVFDLTYACNAAMELVQSFNRCRLPYDNINVRLNSEVERYNGLIFSLQMLPPSLARDTIRLVGTPYKFKGKMPVMLDTASQRERAVCIDYATTLRDNVLKMQQNVTRDSVTYAYISNVVNRVGAYAEKKYDVIQQSIFQNTETNYFSILGDFGNYYKRAVHDFSMKYEVGQADVVKSEWRGQVVLGYVIFVLFYLGLSTLISFFLVSVIWRLIGKSNYITGCEDSVREQRQRRLKTIRGGVTTAIGAMVFAISIMVVKNFLTHNFYIMASDLLIEFAWLFVAITFSLLLRLQYNRLRHGMLIYLPMIVLGLVIIIFRIMFIPNNLVNLVFPLVALAFLWWQWRSVKKHTGKLLLSQVVAAEPEEEADDDVEDAAEEEEETDEKEKNFAGHRLYKEHESLVSEDAIVAHGIASLFKRRSKEKNLSEASAQFSDEDCLPRIDKIYSYLSLVLMAVAVVLTWSGRTLMSVELVIWWLFQLTAIQTILAVFRLLDLYEKTHLYDRLCEGGANVAEIALGVRKGEFITRTWLYDFIHKALVPIAGAYTVILSILMAAHVFNLTNTCYDIFMYTFINVPGVVRLSIFSIVIVVACFFLFRYFNYAAKAFYRHFRIRFEKQKTGKKKLRTNEVNLTLGYNVITILIWGSYFIFILILLRIPKSGISLVTAGLATGVGFAMKDLLNNFFYGISLMAGRLRVGDWIECEGVRGRVESITYQSVQIHTLDNSTMSFLNSTLFANNFRNLTRNNSYEFLSVEVGVAYGSDIEKVREYIKDAIMALQRTDKYGRNIIDTSGDRSVIVRLNNFGDSSIDLKVFAWVLVVEKPAFVAAANEAIYNVLREHNIEIPFPQRTVHLNK